MDFLQMQQGLNGTEDRRRTTSTTLFRMELVDLIDQRHEWGAMAGGYGWSEKWIVQDPPTR